jgi:hypothetical protein
MAACSTSPKNYKTEGEKFLESEDLAKSAGYRYKYALCDQPQTLQVVQFDFASGTFKDIGSLIPDYES